MSNQNGSLAGEICGLLVAAFFLFLLWRSGSTALIEREEAWQRIKFNGSLDHSPGGAVERRARWDN